MLIFKSFFKNYKQLVELFHWFLSKFGYEVLIDSDRSWQSPRVVKALGSEILGRVLGELDGKARSHPRSPVYLNLVNTGGQICCNVTNMLLIFEPLVFYSFYNFSVKLYWWVFKEIKKGKSTYPPLTTTQLTMSIPNFQLW